MPPRPRALRAFVARPTAAALGFALLWLLASAFEGAGPGSCTDELWQGQAPVVINAKLAKDTRELCFSAYVVLHSGITRTPLWAAEHLTRSRIRAAHELDRVNSFHVESRLPPDERSELEDYERSGYDRGHMAPSGDMPTPQAMEESFSLANMIPQNPDDNRRLWAGIEAAVRNLATKDGEVYVVTGPIFRGESLESLNGRVLVPTEIFKAVYDPKRNAAGAYVVKNAPGPDYRVVSLADLEPLAGIAAFPGLPDAVKATAMDLPSPHERGREPTATASAGRERPRAKRPPRDFVDDMLRAIDSFGQP